MIITYNKFVQFVKMLNKFADENNFSFQYSTNKNKNQCGLYEYANSYEYRFIHNPTDRTFKYTVKWDLVDSLSEAASTIFADLKSQTIICSYPSLDITKVIFNSPATIVMWSDGTKTIVKCKKDEKRLADYIYNDLLENMKWAKNTEVTIGVYTNRPYMRIVANKGKVEIF